MPRPQPAPRNRLIDARIQRGWSQHEVANRIGSTYVNVSRWERGITKPNPYFRRKLCALFNRSEEELDLGMTVEEAPGVHTSESALPQQSTPQAVEPAPTSTALYDPTIPLRPPVPLVGRDRELGEIKQLLRTEGSVALSALNGLPGVGKTALSITLAHDPEIRAHFHDGILWAGLGPHPNIAGQLNRWGSLLGLSALEMSSLMTDEAWAKALRTAIGSRAMLLVIDDAWELEHALTFKVGGPNCAHIVTTRFPTIASYIALNGATLLRALDDDESLALLKKLAPGVVELEPQKASDLIHAVGGLPLALTLMGNYLRKQAYTGQTRRIHAALDRLARAEERLQISEPHGPVESHTSLTEETQLSLLSVFSVTDQQLDEPVRSALYALSVFPPRPDTFSEEAALAVASCTLDILDSLIDSGLLESSESDRYTLHQTIADYARYHLQDTEPYDRFIAYAIDFLESNKKNYEQLEVEYSILLAALEAAYRLDRKQELIRAATAFAPYLLLRGLYPVAEQHLQRAHQAAQNIHDSAGIASTLLYLGEIAQKQGNYTEAERSYQEGLSLARRLDDSERISALLTNLGWVAWKQGHFPQAEAYLQEGLTIARQLQDRERIVGLLQVLGSVAANQGNYAQSKAYLQEGLTLARQLQDREQICLLLIKLGATVGEQGNHIQAEKFFLEALELARRIRHQEWISALLTNLGEAANAQENYAKAAEYIQEGLILARQLGHREWITILLLNLGMTVHKQGNYQQAEIYFQESLSIAQQLGIPQMTATVLYEYGNLCLEKSQPEKAQSIFKEMLSIIPSGVQDLIALAQYGLARVAAKQNNIEEARELGITSAQELEMIGHRAAPEVKEWLSSL